MTDTTLFRKSVILRNFDISKHPRNISPVEGCSVRYDQVEGQNLEAIATVIGPRSKIDKQMQRFDPLILSDRFRRLQGVPKWRLIGTKKVRVQ